MKSSSNKHLHGRVSIDIAIKDEQLQGPAVMRYLARERGREGGLVHHLGTVLRSQMEKISQMERSSINEISTGLLFWFWSDFTMSRSIIDDIGFCRRGYEV